MTLLQRPRRLRHTPALRRMVRETTLDAGDMIAPLFIVEGRGIVKPIGSMPGQAQRSVDQIDGEIDELAELRIPAVLLFGIPCTRMPAAAQPGTPTARCPAPSVRSSSAPPRCWWSPMSCMCEYTDHGHCGLLNTPFDDLRIPTVANDPPTQVYQPSLPDGYLLNDETCDLLARAALAYAEAGADIVAPSAMIDGQVAAIRELLDRSGYAHVPIMAYAVKFASAFYGPFREAAESAPKFGDRQTYQMDPANGREALREAALDVAEGADMLMVKPAGAYLDIIHATRERFDLPLAAYQVSGEYRHDQGRRAERLDRRAPRRLESLVAIKRAGADMIITYYAKEAARWLATGER